mmetsp:Transcript_2214/g.5244  ORF Transcript_2214/g.5244 Transcript_2214/m.5244 type:complete len:320 (+) Transcript_2214:707-1666(+)
MDVWDEPRQHQHRQHQHEAVDQRRLPQVFELGALVLLPARAHPQQLQHHRPVRAALREAHQRDGVHQSEHDRLQVPRTEQRHDGEVRKHAPHVAELVDRRGQEDEHAVGGGRGGYAAELQRTRKVADQPDHGAGVQKQVHTAVPHEAGVEPEPKQIKNVAEERQPRRDKHRAKPGALGVLLLRVDHEVEDGSVDREREARPNEKKPHHPRQNRRQQAPGQNHRGEAQRAGDERGLHGRQVGKRDDDHTHRGADNVNGERRQLRGNRLCPFIPPLTLVPAAVGRDGGFGAGFHFGSHRIIGGSGASTTLVPAVAGARSGR